MKILGYNSKAFAIVHKERRKLNFHMQTSSRFDQKRRQGFRKNGKNQCRKIISVKAAML